MYENICICMQLHACECYRMLAYAYMIECLSMHTHAVACSPERMQSRANVAGFCVIVCARVRIHDRMHPYAHKWSQMQSNVFFTSDRHSDAFGCSRIQSYACVCTHDRMRGLHCMCQFILEGASSGHDVPLRTSPTWQANTSIDTCNRMQRNAVVCARMHTRSNVCLCTHMQSHAVACSRMQLHAVVFARMHTRSHTRACMRIHAAACSRMRMYAYTIVCVCMYTDAIACSRMQYNAVECADREPALRIAAVGTAAIRSDIRSNPGVAPSTPASSQTLRLPPAAFCSFASSST